MPIHCMTVGGREEKTKSAVISIEWRLARTAQHGNAQPAHQMVVGEWSRS